MGLYIVANADGHVISSTDGLNWTEPFDTGISIGKAAVGPGKIVYTRCDVEKKMTPQPGLFYASAWNHTPALAAGTGQYYYNEVHYLGGKFVAVGYENTSPISPAFAYSEDGVNWTIGDVDPVYIALVGSGNDMQFNDVGYNGTGYFIISKVSGEGLAGGFYTGDLSQGLYEQQWVDIINFPVDANQLLFTDISGGENWGAWSVFSDDRKTWVSTFNEDPSEPWNSVNLDLTQIFQEHTGLSNLEIAEATIGVIDEYVTWMVSTSDGQIIWWPHVPAGPFVSVPEPYTASVVSVENLNPLEVHLSSNGEEGPALNNERITISGATDSTPGASPGFENLDGSYFVESLGSGNYRLHTDRDLESPVDASSWIGSYNEGSGTASMSRGVFIDALGYGDGNFFAGNDAEEVFMCSEIDGNDLVWTKVEDLNNSLEYWNDVDYGDFGASVSYTYEFSDESPETMPNYRHGGPGNLDTTVYENEGGARVSRQRTGYFEIVNAVGGRKVVEVYDGETVDDTVEVPSVPANPTGNPNVLDSGSTF
jgi:hypothetical protein